MDKATAIWFWNEATSHVFGVAGNAESSEEVSRFTGIGVCTGAGNANRTRSLWQWTDGFHGRSLCIRPGRDTWKRKSRGTLILFIRRGDE